MRDKVIHAYFGVKLERVWEVINRNLRKILEELKED